MMKCMTDASQCDNLSRMHNGETRGSLDGPVLSAWDTFAIFFNNFSSPAGQFDNSINDLDLNVPVVRTAAKLKSMFSKYKASFTLVMSRWEASGQMDNEADINDFIHDSTAYAAVVLFMFNCFRDKPDLLSFSSRLLPMSASMESGLGEGTEEDEEDADEFEGGSAFDFELETENQGEEAECVAAGAPGAGGAGALDLPSDSQSTGSQPARRVSMSNLELAQGQAAAGQQEAIQRVHVTAAARNARRATQRTAESQRSARQRSTCHRVRRHVAAHLLVASVVGRSTGRQAGCPRSSPP